MAVYLDPLSHKAFGEGGVEGSHDVNADAVKGNVIMPKLANATAKAELGRATWKLMYARPCPCTKNVPEFSRMVNSHTMTLRFPEVKSLSFNHRRTIGC